MQAKGAAITYRLHCSKQAVLLQYEDQLLQALALSVMPLDRLTIAAEDAAALSRATGEEPPKAAEDRLAQELLNWFKHEFFTWVGPNAAPFELCYMHHAVDCTKCGQQLHACM